MPSLIQAYSNSVAPSTVLASIQQADGKVILAGGFTSWNGSSVGRIVRLNTNGTVDTSFLTNIGTGANINSVTCIALQSDGKILVGGSFTAWNGTSASRIARLNSNGTLDTAFTTTAIPNGNVNSIRIQSDGKIIIGGTFTTTNTVTTGRIARLNSNGTLDTAFTTNNGTGANASVDTVNIQSDGKIIIGGNFSAFNGVSLGRFARLNPDGTRDTAFTTNAGSAAAATVQDCKIQPDGKIVIVGDFKTWNGVTVGGIVRLNSDGTRDTAFTTNVGTADSGNNGVGRVVIQSDGKIIAVGSFTLWSGATRNRIVRLNSGGTLDSTFATNVGTAANNRIDSISIESDGSIVLGGIFTTWNGATSNYFVVLNSSGILDTTYPKGWRAVTMPYTKVAGVWKPAKAVYNKVAGTWYASFLQGGIQDLTFTTNAGTAANGSVYSIVVQSDGKIIVGGEFTTWNGVTVNRIVRLNSDGTRDTAFTTNTGTGANNVIRSLTTQSDGKILVGGNFTTWNGVTVGCIVRLNADGTRDTAFTNNAGTGSGGGYVTSIVIQSDGKIIVGGGYLTWNGVTVNGIVRLNSDGTRDTAFTNNTGTATGGVGTPASYGIQSVAIQSDGKIVIGGNSLTWNGATVNRIVRLNTDGTRDTAFTTNTGGGANSAIRSLTTQSDGKILIGGLFNTWNGFAVGYIVRLSSDGTRDTAFTNNTGSAANGGIYSIKVQSDGKIIVGGGYTTWNGVTVNRIVRLNGDGTRDTAFTTNTGTGADNDILSTTIISNKNILVGGLFTTWNGATVNRIARIGAELAL